jgi:hypothetical protein
MAQAAQARGEQIVGLWRIWRFPPDGYEDPGSAFRVYLVQVPDGAAAPAIAAELRAAVKAHACGMRLPSWTMLAVCPTLAVVMTVVAYRDMVSWAGMSHRAEAVVTRVQSQTSPSYHGGPGDTQSSAVTVVFMTAQGRRIHATQFGNVSMRVGQRLPITYDPNNPDHVRWSAAVDQTPTDEFCAALLWGISILLLVAWRRKRRSLSAQIAAPVT